MKNIEISFIYVQYGDTKWLIKSIESLYNQIKNDNFEIIVVDNGTPISEKNDLRTLFSNVIWLEMGYNAGFGRANNFGINHSQGKYIALTNPDTIFIEDFITPFIDFFDKNPEIIAASPQLYYKDMSLQLTGHFFVKGGLNHLLPVPYIGNLIKKFALLVGKKAPHIIKSTNETSEADWINGAFMFIRKDLLKNSGLFDEDFFMYAEEVEWCSRLGKFGKIILFNNYSLIHIAGVTSTSMDEKGGYYDLYTKKGLQLIVSNHLRIRKQYGVKWFLFLLIGYFLGAMINLLFTILLFAFIKNRNITLNNAFQFSKNVILLLSYSPSIIKNEKKLYKVI